MTNEKKTYMVTVDVDRDYTFGPVIDDGIGAEQVWQGIGEFVPTSDLMPEGTREALEKAIEKLPDDQDFQDEKERLTQDFWDSCAMEWENLPDDSLRELLEAAVKSGFVNDYEIVEYNGEENL